MDKHTPTPWYNWGTDHQGRRPTICDKAPGNGYSISSEIASVNRDADAAFIVRAVNVHEELIDTIKGLLEWVPQSSLGGSDDRTLRQDVLALIAKAEGK